MKKFINKFIQKFTFEGQLGITVTLGILFLALSSALVGSWQTNERVRHNLLEQGQRITENLARQSTVAPGSPSPLRPRYPPILASMRIAWPMVGSRAVVARIPCLRM